MVLDFTFHSLKNDEFPIGHGASSLRIAALSSTYLYDYKQTLTLSHRALKMDVFARHQSLYIYVYCIVECRDSGRYISLFINASMRAEKDSI